MKKRRFSYCSALIVLIVAFAPVDSQAGQSCPNPVPGQPPEFSGTFLQLLPDIHKNWTTSQWKTLFSRFKALGLRQLIIQWSAYNDEKSFPFKSQEPTPFAELETIFKLADEFNISILAGLNYDSAYWRRIGQERHTVNNYLEALREKNVQLAHTLANSFRRHPSFSGWYITEEIDDVNWNSAAQRENLIGYLQPLTSQLRLITPNKTIAISGFSNAALKPVALTELWREILAKTSIDTVLFQDGIGANKLTLTQLPDYLNAVYSAAKSNQKHFKVVIEVFKQTAGFPLDKKEFKAAAAPLERVLKQMQIASAYSPALLAFSIPEYMTPEAAGEAPCLFKAFSKTN